MALPKSWTTVTPLSKLLALILFITLPIGAFFLGLHYEEYFGPKKITSGIYGTALRGPIAPTERAGEVNDKPYQGTFIIKSLPSNTQVAQFKTGADGSFRLPIKPGNYSIGKAESGYPLMKEKSITVPENEYVQVPLSLDTGIR